MERVHGDKSKRSKARVFAGFILAAAFFLYYCFDSSTEAAQYAAFAQTDFVLSFNFEDRADAHSFGGKGFFHSTKDGMSYYTSSGEIKWTDIYAASLKDPIVFGAGQFIGVCDAGGTQFLLYSKDGYEYTVNYDERILCFYVSPGGYASVIRKDGNDYAIHAYNRDGVQINCYYARGAGTYPVYSSISSDGRILALCIIDVNSAIVESKIMLLYNNMEEKQAFLNGVFYQESIVGEFLARADFLPSGNLVYVTDKAAACISTLAGGSNTPGGIWRHEFGNELASFTVTQGGNIALAYGLPFISENAKEPGTVEIYNADMELIREHSFTQENVPNAPGSASVISCGDFIVASAANTYAAFDGKGRLVWEYQPAGVVRKIMILENKNTILQLEHLNAPVLRKR